MGFNCMCEFVAGELRKRWRGLERRDERRKGQKPRETEICRFTRMRRRNKLIYEVCTCVRAHVCAPSTGLLRLTACTHANAHAASVSADCISLHGTHSDERCNTSVSFSISPLNHPPV